MNETLMNGRKFAIGGAALLAIALAAALFFYGLGPADAGAPPAEPAVFAVARGESFVNIMNGLGSAGLIRSPFAASAYAFFTGRAFTLQPGAYRLSPAMSAAEMIRELSAGIGREVTVTIPPDSNIYQVDSILADSLVISHGDLVSYAAAHPGLEGKLFPDTYKFFTASAVGDVASKFLENFNMKAGPVLARGQANATSDLILASIIEKEVPDQADQSIVAGILLKRERAGIPLQVDSTVCYAMWAGDSRGIPDCGALDLKLASPYNTYLNKGFPPGPIGSPDLQAIEAVMSPKSSPYWYYLSDPKTGKTIYATTLDEQHRNTVKYLNNS